MPLRPRPGARGGRPPPRPTTPVGRGPRVESRSPGPRDEQTTARGSPPPGNLEPLAHDSALPRRSAPDRGEGVTPRWPCEGVTHPRTCRAHWRQQGATVGVPLPRRPPRGRSRVWEVRAASVATHSGNERALLKGGAPKCEPSGWLRGAGRDGRVNAEGVYGTGRGAAPLPRSSAVGLFRICQGGKEIRGSRSRVAPTNTRTDFPVSGCGVCD